MDDYEIRKRAEAERDRITGILLAAGVSEKRMNLLEPVIANTAWMKAKLDDARAAIKNAQIAISYDNGGGQKGIRENPLFKGYESLWKSYMQGMGRIIDSMPQEASEIKTAELEKPKTMLELVRERHKLNA